MKILICDDNTLAHEIYKIFLPEEALTSCFTGYSAIKLAEKEPFDLLIMDIGLPDGSGLDFALKVLQSQPAGLYVALVTAHLLGSELFPIDKLHQIKTHPHAAYCTFFHKDDAQQRVVRLVSQMKVSLEAEAVEG